MLLVYIGPQQEAKLDYSVGRTQKLIKDVKRVSRKKTNKLVFVIFC